MMLADSLFSLQALMQTNTAPTNLRHRNEKKPSMEHEKKTKNEREEDRRRLGRGREAVPMANSVEENECTKNNLIRCLFVSMFQFRLLVKWSWLAQ